MFNDKDWIFTDEVKEILKELEDFLDELSGKTKKENYLSD